MSLLANLKASSSGLSVLCIDANEATLKQTSGFLQHIFQTVYFARDNKSGAVFFKQYRPDIVFVAVDAKSGAGFDMVSMIKEMNQNAQIVLTSTEITGGVLLKTLDIGAYHCIKIPLDMAKVAELLLKLIPKVKSDKQAVMLNATLRSLLNAQKVLIFATNAAMRITICNQAFLNFSGFQNLKALRDAKFNFKSIVVPIDGYLDKDFLEKIIAQPNIDESMLKLALKNANGSQEVFATSVAPTQDKGEYIVSLTKITEFENFKTMSSKDLLTGVFTKSKLDEVAQSEITQYEYNKSPLSIIKLDIDHLGSINTLKGQDAGDKILKKACNVISSLIWQKCIFARDFQDKFFIFAPNTNISEAFHLAEQIRKHIEATDFNDNGVVTCSLGVAEYIDGENYRSFVDRAAQAFKIAKTYRNYVYSFDPLLEKETKQELKKQELFDFIGKLIAMQAKKEQLDLSMFLKGLIISNPVEIAEVNEKDSSVLLNVPPKRLQVFQKFQKAYFKIPTESRSVGAEVARIWLDAGLMELNNFSFHIESPIDRKLVMIQPQVGTIATIDLHTGMTGCELIDISQDAFRLRAANVAGIVIGLDVDVLFDLSADNLSFKSTVNAKIVKFFYDADERNYVINFNYTPSDADQKNFIDYFLKRQSEILKEIRS